MQIMELETRCVKFVQHKCPWWQQTPNKAKISFSYILTLHTPNPRGHVVHDIMMFLKSYKTLGELKV